jgi:hypothetical protein
MRLAFPLLLAASAATLSAQPFQRHHFSGGLGIAMPKDDLHPFFQNALSWSFGYGYRPARNFQIDAGLDSSYHAANVTDWVNSSQFGPLKIRDFQFFAPVGGRAVIPVGRVQFYAGGGFAYLRYTELLRQPSDWVRLECPDCRARDGVGAYALLGGDVAVDRRQSLRLGVVSRVYMGKTAGPGLGALPGRRTDDRWWNTYLTLTFSF